MLWKKSGEITFRASVRRALRELQLDTGMYFASAIPLEQGSFIRRQRTKYERPIRDERIQYRNDSRKIYLAKWQKIRGLIIISDSFISSNFFFKKSFCALSNASRSLESESLSR